MKKRIVVGLVTGAIVASAAAGAYVAKPIAEQAVAPLVKEQLNNAIRGTVQYDKLDIDWSGKVSLSHVNVKDENNEPVAEAKKVSVGISPTGVLRMILNNAGAVGVLGTIQVKDPIVYVREYGDNTWNFEHLIKKTDDSTSMDYKGTVEIKNGIIHLTDHRGAHITFTDVDGAFKFADYPLLKGAASAKLGKDVVKLSGSYVLKGSADFDATIETKHLNLEPLKRFVTMPDGLQVNSAALKDTTVRIKRNDEQLQLQGTAHLDDIAGSYSDYTVDQGSATIRLDGTMLKIVQSDFRLNGNVITAAGAVNLGDPNYTVHGNVHMPMGHLESLVPDQGMEGEVDATAIIDGSIYEPIVSGKITSPRISFKGSNINDIKANYSYDHGIVSITEASLKKDGGEGAGYGLYRIADHSYEGHVELQSLDISALSGFTDTSLAGTVTGNVFFSGKDQQMEALSANITGTDVSVEGVEASSVDAFVSAKDGVYTIHHSALTFGDGVATITGTWSPSSMDIAGTMRAVPMENFQSFVPVSINGKIDGTFHVSGTMDDPTGDFMLGVADGNVAELPFSSGSAKGTISNHQVHLDEAILSTRPGIYAASGDIGIGADDAINLDVSVDNARAEILAKPFSTIPVTGWVYGTGHISGTRNNPNFRGAVALREGSFYGKLISELAAKATYADNVLTVDDVILAGYDSEIHGKGRMMGDKLDFVIGGDNIQLNRVFRNDRFAVTGTATIVGKLEGTLDNPVFKGQFGASKLSVNDVAIQAFGGDVYADKSVVYAEKVKFLQDGGEYDFSGGMRLGNETLFGKATVKKGNVENLIHLFQIPISSYQGFLSGEVDLGGVLTNPRVDVRGKIENTTIQGKPQKDAEVDATLANKELNIRKLNMPIGDGYIAALGKADFKDALAIQVAANNVPAELLVALSGKDIPLTGTLDGFLNATGKTDNPELQLSLNLEKPTFNGVKLDHVYAMATMKDWQIRIRQLLAQREQYKGTIYGNVPFAAIFPKYEVGEDRNVNLKVNLSEADLGVLPLLSTSITAGEGPLDGIITITGPLDNLEANGTVSVEKGSLSFKGVKQPLSNIHGSIDFKGQQGTVNVSGDMGKGKATVSGNADWTGGTLKKYNLEAVSDHLEVESPYFTGPLDAQVSISDSDTLPLIKGNINLHDVKVDVPLSFSSESSSFDAKLDVDVQLGNNVRLYNAMLYDLLITGHAHYGWRLSFPRGDGKFVVEKGTIRYLNNRFQISEAEAAYNDIGTFLPNLHVVADTNVNHYRIRLGLDGMPTAMAMKLTSEPALTQEQIISLLTLKTTGKNSDGVDQNEAGNLVSAGLAMAVFGPVENLLQNQLHMDQVQITTNSLDPYQKVKSSRNSSFSTSGSSSSTVENYYSLEMGKYVLPNTMVTYGTGLNYNLSKFGLIYELGRNFNVNTWYTTEQNYFFGGQWRYQF